MDDAGTPPLVLMHCGWPGDRELVGRMLASLGVRSEALGPETDLRRLLADDGLDLVLADSSGGLGPLGELIATLDAEPQARDLPIVLLADATDVSMLADLTARRFNATLLAKPVEPTRLVAALRAGLRYWAGRRENRRLLAHLEAARAEAEAARRRFHDLVQGIDSVVWEADAATGRFTFISRRAEDLFGYPVDRWLAEPGFWLERVHPEDREYAGAAWRGGLGGGRDFELEYRAVAADGRTLWLREAVRLVRDDQDRPIALRGLMWNITQRKKVERQLYRAKTELARQLADLNYLHELSTRLSATAELTTTLEEVLAAVMEVQGAESGLVRLYDRRRDDLEIVASAGLPATYLERYDRVAPGVNACGIAAAEGRPIIIEDVEADPVDVPCRDAARLGGFRAEYSTPLVGRGGDLLGTIATFFGEPHRPPERQVRLVELYARQAADIVEAARLHQELREADRRKDEFVAQLAHELRNPLAAIRTAAHLLGLDDDGPAREEARAVIGRQERHMTRLVEDLLDASRVRRGTIELRKEPVELAGAVGRAVEAARPLIDARGHELTVQLPATSVWLEADPVRLVQVLANLLTNAAKFTEPGGRISLEAGPAAGDSVTLRVRDSGVGIAPEMLPRIFDLFTRADPSPGAAGGGLGIGLALVKGLVERHGGTVAASSPGPGRGSEFVVRLPVRPAPVQPPAPGSSVDRPRPAPRPLRILVVDDSVDMARGVARLLKSWGHDVRVAHDGPSALEVALGHVPEVVLLDIGLPGMDGAEVARRLREAHGEGPRCVALTGYGRDEDRRRSREAGFADHLVKPVDPEDLRRALGRSSMEP